MLFEMCTRHDKNILAAHYEILKVHTTSYSYMPIVELFLNKIDLGTLYLCQVFFLNIYLYKIFDFIFNITILFSFKYIVSRLIFLFK